MADRRTYTCLGCGSVLGAGLARHCLEDDSGCPECGGDLSLNPPEEGFEDTPNVNYDRLGRPVDDDGEPTDR